MFRKRQYKQEYYDNRTNDSKYHGKRSLRFSANFNSKLVGKSEFHCVGRLREELAGLRSGKKYPYIVTASSSILGNRFNQQDSFFVTKSTAVSPFKLTRTFGVVCDGMGGLEAGDRASLTAVSMMKLAFDKLPKKRLDIPHFFSEMINYIDCEINSWDDLKSDKGAGTTMVSVIIENRRLYWASVGDSSIFMFQDNTLKKITSEHNYKMYLDRLVENGSITKSEAEHDPRQNALLSYIGMGGVAYRDINSKPYNLRDGDMLVLCSDGVTDTVDEDELVKIILDNEDDAVKCCCAITDAVKAKKLEEQDNATVVIVQYLE